MSNTSGIAVDPSLPLILPLLMVPSSNPDDNPNIVVVDLNANATSATNAAEVEPRFEVFETSTNHE